nr:MAG TPA: hypothetical protein [Caudoviricetes sp.]
MPENLFFCTKEFFHFSIPHSGIPAFTRYY